MSRRDEFHLLESQQTSLAHLALLKLLTKLGLIREEQANLSLMHNDYFPIAYFANSGGFDEWQAIQAVSAELKVPAIQLTQIQEKVALEVLDKEPCSAITVGAWSKLRALPFSTTEDVISLAMANPLDIETVRSLEFELQRSLKVYVAAERQILAVLAAKRGGREGLDFSTLLKAGTELEVKNPSIEGAKQESNIVTEDIAAPTVIKLVNKIFSAAVLQGASDIHISPESNRLTVRFRLDGIMRDFIEVPSQLQSAVISRVKVLCGMDIAERRQPQDGRLRLKTSSGDRDLRVSSIPTAYGEDIVARVLSSELAEVTFDTLGMPLDIQDRFKRVLSGSSHVVIVAGPTGSGKTSTLYGAVGHLRDGTNRIVTIEDPIEYRIQGVSQIQVNAKVGMTFDSALRSVLRQDPDVVLVGEIRDSETAQTTMQVAQTGHLVLTTLHTNNAAAAVTRLRDLGIPSYLVASSLQSVIAQRLVRRLCQSCAEPASAKHLARAQELGLKDCDKLLQARGCNDCSHTGYKGRIGIYSFLEISPEVAKAIRENLSEPELEALARSRGYESLAEAALKAVYARVTSLEEVERVLGLLDTPGVMPEPSLATAILPSVAENDGAGEEENTVITRRKILLVDDDENVRSIFQSVLEYAMFDVNQAEDGFEALKSVYECPPELVICDLMMPKMNGLELVEKLRADPRTRSIPVLMLTAAATEENELELIKSGADDFVSKTAKTELIVARINRLINR